MGVKCFWIEPTGKKIAHKTEHGSSTSSEYVRPDTGETHERISDFGPGAMYDCHWYRNLVGGHIPHMPPDGRILAVVLPNGNVWLIDSRCSNCTLPDDKQHSCWVRHGEPPNVTVDKNGLTCQAGAGSIMSGGWHGFLRNGELVE